MKKSRLYVCLLAGSALIYACGGGSQKQSAESTDTAVAEVPAEVVADSVTLEISANDNMQFSTDQLKVTEGQVVTLNFKHTGKMPYAELENMQPCEMTIAMFDEHSILNTNDNKSK